MFFARRSRELTFAVQTTTPCSTVCSAYVSPEISLSRAFLLTFWQWKNPRATGISFAASVLFIFAARYLHVLRYIFKGLYVILFRESDALSH